jgi:hypothetical protein
VNKKLIRRKPMIMNGRQYNTSEEGSTVWILIAAEIVITVVMGLEYLIILGVEKWILQ